MKIRSLTDVSPWAWLLLALALGWFGWVVGRGWSLPLTDSHSSRQAQTAITAELLHENGAPPLTPFNGLGPPWSVPMEFPSYQMLTAVIAHLTGGDIVEAGRVAAILGALATLPALGLLLRRIGVGPVGQALCLALLLIAPLFGHFSRALLIESWATALAWWWLATFVEALERESSERRWLVAAALLGIAAALSKITTFAVVLLPAAIFAGCRWRVRGWAPLWRAATATLPGLVAGVWWTRWSDAAKAAHPYADFLTSANLSSWNWGTLEQRLDPAWWERWGMHLEQIVPVWSGLIVIAGLVVGSPRLRTAIGLALLAAATGPLAFANLYYVHNYYFMAVTPAVVAVVALSLIALAERWGGSRAGRTAIVATGLLVLAAQGQAYMDGLGRGQLRNRPVPELAHLIRELSQPDDVVVVYGREWDPLVTFYAERRMTGIRGTHETDNDAWAMSQAALLPDRYTVLVALDSVAGDKPFLRHRCRELGLDPDPVAATDHADVYVSPEARVRLAPVVAALRDAGRLLPHAPERMGPGESRLEWVAPEWRDLPITEALDQFAQCEPLPDQVFTRHQPAQMQVDGRTVLHLHPPGGLKFDALSRDRRITFDYGIMPEIWEKERDTDGVRFTFFVRPADGRQRELWSDFLRPRSDDSDQGPQHVELTLPANHLLELHIDAGPDHNPGYDWSYIAGLNLTTNLK